MLDGAQNVNSKVSSRCGVCFQHDSLEPCLSTCVQALCARTYLLISGVKWSNEKFIPRKRNVLLSNPHNYQCHQNPFYCSLMVKWLTKLQSEMPFSPDVRKILLGFCHLIWFYVFYFSVRQHIMMVSHQFPFVVMVIPHATLNTRRFSYIRLSILSSMWHA